MARKGDTLRRESVTKKKPVKVMDEDNYSEGEQDGYDDNGQESYLSEESESESRPKKKAKNGRKSVSNRDLIGLFSSPGETSKAACEVPTRSHAFRYHQPLLLAGEDGKRGRKDLLTWFDGVSTSRSMPWRKTWVNPSDFPDKAVLRETLKRRAYEVWISEIMLQQTRVSTVISYWTNWIAKWPTIEDLAKAEPDEVLSAWRGLGYYSRATRIHTAAKKVVDDVEMQGLLPETTDLLQKNVPGVGRYTGGAISSIVFGNAAAMVDGNVLRVLSRQLGVYGDVKGSKQVIDLLWNAADALVKKVAHEDGEQIETDGKSDRPGRWGQALMELGSTICTPNPVCRSCPIAETCRAFAEGKLLASKAGLLNVNCKTNASIADIEDMCTLCEPFEDDATLKVEAKKTTKEKGKQSLLSSFVFTAKGSAKVKETPHVADIKNPKVMEIIEQHTKKFPMKVVKKAVREEETIVCAVRNEKGEYLLHQRPDKGLLAGLWELPSSALSNSNDSKSSARTDQALTFVESLVGSEDVCTHKGEVGVVPWLFSHLKLTMHVHLIVVQSKSKKLPGRWATRDQVEEESMGTGMRKCWSLVKDL